VPHISVGRGHELPLIRGSDHVNRDPPRIDRDLVNGKRLRGAATRLERRNKGLFKKPLEANGVLAREIGDGDRHMPEHRAYIALGREWHRGFPPSAFQSTARARPGVRFDDGADAIVGGSRVER
jgi:hypothetical protein